MSKLASDLRARTAAQVLALSAAQRIELAFALGEEDLMLFMRASGLDRGAALHHFRVQRQRGRVPSACATARPR